MYSYIYLLQEREFIKTKENIYKLGKSKQENLGRVKQYPKGSKLIIQSECENCDITETALKKTFKESFKQRIDIGTEYFEGNSDAMRKIICDYINNEIINDVIHNEDTDEMDKPEIEIDDDVKILFPNYCDDESFGGTKQLIKIYIEVDKIIIKYIDCEINNWNDTPIHNYMVEEVEIEIEIDKWDNNCKYFDMKYKDNYYNKIIKNKVIENNKTYELNDVRFIRRLDKYKHSIKLHYSDKLDYINDKYRLHFKGKFALIRFYIQNNAILNDVIYCGLIKNNCYIQFSYVELQIYIKTINGFGFDYDYLKKYTPYCINTNDDEYYMLNRDYKGINTDNAYTLVDRKQIWLHKGNGCPWAYDKEEEIKELYKKLSETLKKTTTNKICLNENEHTNIILTKCI